MPIDQSAAPNLPNNNNLYSGGYRNRNRKYSSKCKSHRKTKKQSKH